jgi:hypothetical protein
MPLLTELDLFFVWVPQRCRAYGAGNGYGFAFVKIPCREESGKGLLAVTFCGK